jgi:hypothetical protein
MKRKHSTAGVPLSAGQRELLAKLRAVYPHARSSISTRQKVTIDFDTPQEAIDCMQLLHDLGFTGYQAMKWANGEKTNENTLGRRVHGHYPRV